MSVTLLEFAKAYTNDAIDAGQFVESYQLLWKIERDSRVSVGDDPHLSERLSTIFVWLICTTPAYKKKFMSWMPVN